MVTRRPRCIVLVLASLALGGAAAAQEQPVGLPVTPAAGTPPPASTAPPSATPTATASSPSTAAKTPTEDAFTSATTYLVPDAPALTLIGSTSTIERPGTPAKLGVTLLNGVTPQGTVRSGLAVEISARALGISVADKWTQYRDEYWRRLVSRIGISVATTADSATATAAQSTRAGLGMRIAFIDGSDPLLDARYIAKSKFIDTSCKNSTPGDAYQKCIEKASDDFKVTRARWNADGLALAAGTSGAFAEGKLNQGAWADSAVWLTGALGIGDSVQVSGAAQYRYAAIAAKKVGAGAARVRIGSDAFRGVLEGAYATANPSDPINRKGRALAGLELKISDKLWVTASLGGDFAGSDSAVSALALSSLKYALVDAPTEM